MRCFQHREAEAVGLCKSCNKGLCSNCAIDVGKGLACRDSCEEEVRSLNGLIDRNLRLSPASQKVLGTQPGVYLTGGIFLILAGSVFALLGANMDGVFRIGIVAIGVLLAGLGLWQVVYASAIRRATGQLK